MILDFQNNGAVVLTSQEPGAFLNIRWESGDGSISLQPNIISDISSGMLWVNGLDISEEASIYSDPSISTSLYLGDAGDPSTASFFLYTRELGPFDANLTINYTGSSTGFVDVSILNRPYIATSDSINTFETSNVQAGGDTSYLILRTNPKFSGNIKLVVDISNGLYLDTFKVSDVLSNKLYRKQQVSANSVLAGDIRTTFSSMPVGEIYRVGDGETLHVDIPDTNLWKQYDLEYSYGARLFEDELYPEDYSMLAPLWINNTLPDYFAIFRLPGQFNEESYPESGNTPDYSELAAKFLEEGELMESWGIKESTPLGDYLRNHQTDLLKEISPVFLSLSDPNLLNPDPNKWYGISIAKGGIFAGAETPYFFDQKSGNFTDLNAFVSGGFERQNLLCPNLINLEFAFNDDDVSLYTMQRYFGLYLTENPLYEISYYAEDPDSSISIISLDGKDSNEFFSSSLFDSSGNLSSAYTNRLFTLDDVLSIKRITEVSQVDGTTKSSIEEWLNKPGENLFSIEVEEEMDVLPFISFKLNKALSQGEHLRIIDETSFAIYEIYGVDIDLLDAGESWTYASEYQEDGYPMVYRTFFSVKGDIEDQNTAIWNAWSVFQGYINTPFTPWKKKDQGQSLIIEDWAIDHVFKFQRLTAQTVDNPSDPSSGFNTAAGYDDIYFYGTLEPTADDFERISYDSSYGPINFELYGDRMSITVDVFYPQDFHFYTMDSSITDLFDDYMLYLCPDQWYRLLPYFDVSTSINHSLRYIEDPTSMQDGVMVLSDYPIVTINNVWNSYAPYPLTISLMGINPVKDFDYTVYDSSTLDFKSEYWYKRDGDSSTFEFYVPIQNTEVLKCQNSYEVISGTGSITIDGLSETYGPSFKFNTFDGSALIHASSDTRITFATLDSSVEFKSYKTGESEELLEDYYEDPSMLLRYGLTIPTVTKWVGIGSDCRGNSLRLLLDTSILDVSTNFIPYEDAFPGELFYPSFKYLDPGERNWEDYIFFDINDSIEYTQNGDISYTTFKEFMINEPYTDVFSKLVYSNNNVNGTKLRSSIAYYNNYKNSIDTIINGLSLSFAIRENARNIIDIQDWDRYRISAIAVPSRNRDNNEPMEVFINENTETILLVWYQGNDILNYTYRTSSTMMGKGVLDPSESSVSAFQWRGFDSTDKHYSHVKTPFGVNNASLSSNIFNLYGIDSSYNGDIASPFAQSNLNFGDNLFSVFNAYDGNTILGTAFEYNGRQYNTFRQYVDYSYNKSNSTYGAGIANHAYSYMKNDNLYRFDTCSLEVLTDILTYNHIRYYIFRDTNIYTSDSFSSDPIQITINSPRDYRGFITYNGWFKPQFNDILKFSYNEDKDIIDTVQKDFTFSNTNVVSYNNIPQLWYNKVVETVTSYDISVGNAIDYVGGWNPFRSQWDGDYYYLYNQGYKSGVDGYNSTLESPSYFGSKLINLPEFLELGSWDITTTNEDFGPDRMSLSYNLTRSIVNNFKGNDTFISNWGELTQSDNIIDGYIKNTVLSYYNISKPKIKVEIWRKIYKGEASRIAYSLDDTFEKWNAANVNGVLSYVNNEYIYTVNTPVNPMYIYYVKFTLFEK